MDDIQRRNAETVAYARALKDIMKLIDTFEENATTNAIRVAVGDWLRGQDFLVGGNDGTCEGNAE